MGCDIHAFMEIKIKEEWHGVETDIGRNYDLFALMAGVRNYDNVEPVHAPRGFPDDASVITRLEYSGWEEDCHSASWLTYDEVMLVSKRFEALKGKPHSAIERITSDLRRYVRLHGESAETRLVFWFDN